MREALRRIATAVDGGRVPVAFAPKPIYVWVRFRRPSPPETALPATPATTFLEARKVAFDLLEYAHDPRAEAYGLEAAEKLGLDPESVFKTLVVSDGAKAHALALVPVARKLGLPLAAKALGWKRAEMGDKADAQRITGYVLGGISPFGTKRPLAVVADEELILPDRVHVSGGRRGLEIRIAPSDLVAVLGAIVAPIAVD